MPIIQLSNTTISEADGGATLVFTLNEASTQTVSFDYEASSGTTASYNDYTYFKGTLSFAPGQTSISTRVTITNDTREETCESMFVVLSAPKNAQLERTSAAITIIDNDAAVGNPLISISNLRADEAAGMAQFLVSLDKPSSGDVSVNYATQNGTAQAGSDFTAQSGALLFRPGETAKVISVPLLNDSLAETIEQFQVQLSQASGAELGQASGIALIEASDGASAEMPLIRVADTTMSEQAGYVDIVFSLSAPSLKTISVDYGAGNGTTASYNDYASFSGTLTFAPGEISKTLRVAINDDSSIETTEAMGVVLSKPVNALLERDTVTLTIVDNDAALGVPQVSVGNLCLDEKAGLAQFVITLDKPASSSLSLDYATRDVSAQAGSDYQAASGSLNFKPGETSKTVSVILQDDSAAEGLENFQLLLSNIKGGTLAQSVATAIISANDGAAADLPLLRVADSTISEQAGYADLVFNLSAPCARQVSCSFSLGSGTTASYNDYISADRTLIFAPGEVSKTVRIAINNDSSVETRECMFVNLSAPQNAKLERTSAALLIQDNDAPAGVPSISISNPVVDAKSGMAQFVVTLDKPSTTTINLPFATADGTALAGQDYAAQSGSLSFRPGETAQSISVLLKDRGVAQANSMFDVKLGTPEGGANLADATGHARIEAHGAAPVGLPMIHVAPSFSASEAEGYVDLVFSLDAPGTQMISLDYSWSNGTTASYNDYITFSGTLAFAPGETSKAVRLAVNNDSSEESTELFFATFKNPVNAVLERSSSAVTLIDNDVAPGVPNISVGDSVINQQQGYAEFVLTLDKPSTSDVKLSYSTQDGSAHAGVDYLASSGNVVFRAGESSKTVTVLLKDGAPAATAQSFSLNLTKPDNANLADGVGTVLIAPHGGQTVEMPQIKLADTMFSEGDGFVDVVFNLSAPSAKMVSVNYAYGNGTAASYNDLTTFDGTLNFAPGETSKTVRIAINNDSTAESNETFRVMLDKAVNATLERSFATITIADNDSGSHLLRYGMGNDVYEVNSSGDIVYELANGGVDTVKFAMADYSAPENVENLQGNAQNNRLIGNTLNNQLQGGAGNDVLDGGAGIDYAAYSGKRADFTISKTETGFTVTDKTGAEGVDVLQNVERIRFADATVALDGSGAGGQAYRIYQAAFNRVPDSGGLGFWINALEKGAALFDVAGGFVASAEFKTLYGANPTNAEIVSKLYENVLHRQGEPGGFAFWLGLLDNHQATPAQVLASFSESPENQQALATVIGNGFVYTPFV